MKCKGFCGWSVIMLFALAASAFAFDDGSTVVTIYEENFDAAVAGWTTAGTWEIGRPLNGPGTGASPTNCAGTDLDAYYGNNLNDRLISPSISLLALSNATDRLTLSYNEWILSEPGLDEGIAEISTNGGSSWVEFRRASGTSNSWRNVSVDLTGFAGQSVLLGFRFVSDESMQDAGWYVDDVAITHRTWPPLSGSITSLNSLNFPFIYLNVAVWTNGVSADMFEDANFVITEDGTEQTDKKEVLKPSEGGGQRLADVVFIMDNSGSMQEEQNAIESNVVAFVSGLGEEGIDYSLGLCRYGQSLNNGDPIIEDDGILTSDPHYFTNTVWQRNVDDGATEPGYFSMEECTRNFNFRPGAQRVFIVITDESPDQGGTTLTNTIDTCMEAGVMVFALTETNLFPLFTPITDRTSGECFDIYADFGEILQTIAALISQSYLVRYEASDALAAGESRAVEVVVTNNGSTVTLTWDYIPRSAPKIMRTDATLALHSGNHPPGGDIPIAVRIIDNVQPYAQSAKLYYKSTTNSSYTVASMTNTSGNVWTASIPGAAAQVPGVDYFILATDGDTTTSDPSLEPYLARYQLAVSPNFAPLITHTPVTSPVLNTNCTITASISDGTSALDSTTLYYRKTGQLLYQSTNMTNTAGASFEGVIPGAFVTTDGVDYYLRAFDDQGVGSYHGTPDLPHQTKTPEILVNPLSLTADLKTGEVVTQSVTVTSLPAGAGALAFELLAGDNARVSALSFSPLAGYIAAPGGTQDVDVVFDATGLDGGSYNTDIIVLSNDPDASRVVVTGTLNVTAAPDISFSSMALDFGDVFMGTLATQQLDVLNEGFALLNVTSLTCDNGDFAPSASSFSTAAGAGNTVSVVFTSGVLGSESGTVTVVSNDPDHPTNTIHVSANVLPPPVMDVSPLSFNVTLAAGGSSNDTLTIDNTAGGTDLIFTLLMQGSVVDTHPSDTYGYTWLDSNDTNGPAYQWYDITGLGTNAALVGDDTSVSVSLPFTFHFYGKARSSVRLSSNGYITFGVDGSSTGGSIVSPGSPNDVIAPFWDDLISGADGTVHTYHDTLTGRFIVQYTNWEPYGGGVLLTFQVHLCADGDIYFYYKDVDPTLWSTIGTENSAGTDGLLISDSGGYAQDGLAVKIFPQGSFIGAGAGQGLVPAGEQFTVPVQMNAADLPAGVYQRNIVISGNDPFTPQVTVPVVMTVQGIPDISVDPTSIDFGARFVGGSYTDVVRVASSGTDALVVSNVVIDDTNFSASVSGFTVPAGDVYLLEVTYAPTTAGSDVSGTLTLTSNDGDEPAVLVSLAGQRLEPPDISVDTNTIVTSLHVNTTGTFSLAMANTGVGQLSYSIEILNTLNTNGAAYMVLDSNDAGGPSYAWTDISSIGTPSGLTGDDSEVTATIPFTFTYYGVPKTSVKLSSNGFLVLGTDGATDTSGIVPDSSLPNDVIAPFWDDLNQESGSCYTYHDTAKQRFIIQYSNWGRYGGGGLYTFQVHLCRNGHIYFYYQSMSGVINDAAIGIENSDGTEGLAVAGSGDTYVQNGLAVWFMPSGQFLSTAETSGTVAPGASTNIQFVLDGAGLALIDYDAEIIITSNDPYEPELRVPVHLDVYGLFTDLTYGAWETLYWPGGGSGGADADFDGDGASNVEEWLAGTDPTRNDSLLTVDGGPKNGDLSNGFLLEWPSIGGKAYVIDCSEALMDGFVGLVSNIVATPPRNTYNVTNPPAGGKCFYRVRTSKP